MNPQSGGGHPAARRLIIALLIISSFALLTYAAESRDTSPSLYVTPQTVQGWLAQGQRVIFLDVREPDEFAAGHLPGATNISHDHVTSIMDRLDRAAPLILYCIHSAHRAPAAAKTLRTLGFANAYVLDGGIVAWQAGGLTIRASDFTKAPTILPFTERCAKPQGATEASAETSRL